jgi:hypothetical protein
MAFRDKQGQALAFVAKSSTVAIRPAVAVPPIVAEFWNLFINRSAFAWRRRMGDASFE